MNRAIASVSLLLVLLLAACSPQGPQASQAPQVDTDSLGTIAAATVDALLALTQTAQAQPEATLTQPPTPALTPEVTPAVAATAELPADAGMDLKVAYSDGQGNLWFWQSGSDPLQLTASGDVADFALSPDGGKIFFARAAGYVTDSLWLIDTDGSNEREVMAAADFEALDRPAQASGTSPAQLGWVPGSATAVFTTYHYFDGPGFDPGDDLRLVNGSTGAVTTLLEPGEGGGMYFYSPDGAQIALVTPNQIDLINSDGSNRRGGVLVYEDILMYTESPFYAQPVWAADGSRLRVVIPAKDRLGNPDEPGSVWEVPAAGGAAFKVLEFSTNGLGPGAFVSPDLNTLVYFQNVGTGGQQELHIASLDGSADEVYASGSLNWVGWAEDGPRFVWTQFGQVGADRQAYLGQAGQSPVLLGAPQSPLDLAWVAGDRFLFLDNDGGAPPAWTLYLGTVGGPNQVVAEIAAGNQIPRFDFVH